MSDDILRRIDGYYDGASIDCFVQTVSDGVWCGMRYASDDCYFCTALAPALYWRHAFTCS